MFFLIFLYARLIKSEDIFTFSYPLTTFILSVPYQDHPFSIFLTDIVAKINEAEYKVIIQKRAPSLSVYQNNTFIKSYSRIYSNEMLTLLINSYAPSSRCLVQDNITLFNSIEYFDFSIIVKRQELIPIFKQFTSFARYDPVICIIPVSYNVFTQFPKPDFVIFNKAINAFDFEINDNNLALYFNVSFQYTSLYQLQNYNSWVLLLLNTSLIQPSELRYGNSQRSSDTRLICRVLSPDDTNAFYRKLKLGFNITTALINVKEKLIFLCRGRMPTDNQIIDSASMQTDIFDSTMSPGILDKYGCNKNDFYLSSKANFSALFADTSNIPEDDPEI